MIYPDSVRYLYSLGNELKVGAKFGLQTMSRLLTALGNPQAHQTFVHVAGTNGKGSTSALIASILQEAGFRTGLYTSPHLIAPTERIQINGVAVSEEAFSSAFNVVHEAAERLLKAGEIDHHPSYFETVTAMAFHVFQNECNLSVIEVGLGGRLDATNVISPRLCVITPIAYDHEIFLGSTLESIATEKAGILKPNVPVVVSAQLPSSARVIRDRATELGCPIIESKPDDVKITHATAEGCLFTFQHSDYVCPLPGRHQVSNAVTAILACRELQVPASAIQTGLRKTKWPGRLEKLRSSPDFILDGAHNPSGASALAAYIREFHAGHPVWIVFGAMRDKAVEEVTSELFPLAERLILTAPDVPRALRPEAIRDMTDHPMTIVARTVAESLELADQAPANATVFFTGSLFLVGEVRAALTCAAPAAPIE